MSATIGIADWGPLVIATDIDDAAIELCRIWMPTYLRRFGQERGLGFNLALPRSYGDVFAGQEFLDRQLPAVVAVAARGTSMRGGQAHAYEGIWSLELATVVRGKRPAATRFLAAVYEGITRRLIVQQAGGTPLNHVSPTGMRFEQVPDGTKEGRWLLAGVSVFEVRTDKIVAPTAGPDVPDADEYLDEATVVEVDIDVLGGSLVIGEAPEPPPPPPLSFTDFNPKQGSVDGGTVVTLTGTGFGMDTNVTFGFAGDALSVGVAGDGESVTAVSPPYATPGEQQIEVRSGGDLVYLDGWIYE